MADNEEKTLNTTRGNEWEVVSLTASTYAAAPGPKPVELNDDDKQNSAGEDKSETSQAMFMSHHFDFPQSQPQNTEISNEQSSEDSAREEEGGVSDLKDEGNGNTKKGLNDDFMGIGIFDEKGDTLSLNLANKEQSIYNNLEFSTFSNEENRGGSTIVEENRVVNEPIEPSDQDLDSYISNLQKHVDGDKDDETQLPYEGWWKRRAVSLYNHAKETNAMWSIFFAAAVMGLVILGHRWQQDKRRDLQLKWELGINGQKTGRMVGPLYRFKDVIVGGTPRGSFISGGVSREL